MPNSSFEAIYSTFTTNKFDFNPFACGLSCQTDNELTIDQGISPEKGKKNLTY